MSSNTATREARRESSWWQIPIIIGFLLVTLVHALLISPLFLIPRFRREPLGLRLGSNVWAYYSSWLLGLQIRVIGRENLPGSLRGYLYASNHESFVDIVLMTCVIRRAFLMKRSVLLSPVGWGTYLAGSVGFDRSSKGARARALNETLQMAKRSMSVIVFPEGTFGHEDGSLRDPHLNLLRAAFDEGLSVSPLGHAGTRRCVDGQSLPVRRGAEVVLVARPPLSPEDYADRDAFAAACWQEVVQATRQARGEVQPGWPYGQVLR